MTKQYQDKQEAIEALNSGARFHTKQFDSFRDDPDVTLEAIENKFLEIIRISPALQTEEFICRVMDYSGEGFQLLKPEMKANKKVALAAVTNWGHTLGACDEQLRDDRQVVYAAVKNTGSALNAASSRLKQDPEIFHLALETHGWALEHGTESDKANEQTVLKAIKLHPKAIKHASQEIQGIVGDSENPAETLEKFINARDLHSKISNKIATKHDRPTRGIKI